MESLYTPAENRLRQLALHSVSLFLWTNNMKEFSLHVDRPWRETFKTPKVARTAMMPCLIKRFG
jgi:hypothetical protein